MNSNPKIYVAGHKGMVGSAIVRELKKLNRTNIIVKTRSQLDLTDKNQVAKFFKSEKPDQVYLAAARVGGIYANNTYPAEFIYENLMIQANVIHQAWMVGVKKILFLGSSCIYPKMANQPINEESLLSGTLESTNEPYAVAKIAGIKLCESYNRQYSESHQVDYRCVMPTNLFGPGDNYHPENSHVIPGLLHKFHHAKIHNLKNVKIWGSGKVFREFLHVDDMAKACLHVMEMNPQKYNSITSPMMSHLNIGSGKDIAILDLARLIAKVVGFEGEIETDNSKPDGPSRKLLNINKITNMGWSPSIDFEEGLRMTYKEYSKLP